MKRKGFTLVELLVVIAVIALLMSILMPALSRARQMSQRLSCGANLAGIGKTIFAYSNDYDGAFPIAGGKHAKWSATGTIPVWDAITVMGHAKTLAQTAYGGRIGCYTTIDASLFLLVKYSDASPKQFVCKGDQGATVFENLGIQTPLEDITEAWDFGTKEFPNIYPKDSNPGRHVSYSYHMPYYIFYGAVYTGGHAIHSSSSPQSPLMADRNPYCDKNNYDSDNQLIDVALPGWDPVSNLFIDEEGLQNSYAHQREGQEVLYQDGHVKFEEHPNVGIDNDNIWHFWTRDNSADTGDDPATRDAKTEARETGRSGAQYSSRPIYDNTTKTPCGGGTTVPWSEKDAFLVNDYQDVGATQPGRPPLF
jgi:prepilin-type N-terminal cleavage/methylation domain-containing protein